MVEPSLAARGTQKRGGSRKNGKKGEGEKLESKKGTKERVVKEKEEDRDVLRGESLMVWFRIPEPRLVTS